MDHRPLLSRRRVGAMLAAGAALGLTGCGSESNDDRPRSAPMTAPANTTGRSSVLVAYFSRPGENYWRGGRRDLEVGNTAALAGLLAEQLGCDIHEIRAAEPYSQDYNQTVARNVREQDADARPAVADPLPSLAAYDTVLLGSPIWNVRPPMLMRTFAEALDFTGTTVHPFTTYAMSGLGTAQREYAAACRGARIGEGLAVHGEEVRDAGTADDVRAWLERTGLRTTD